MAQSTQQYKKLRNGILYDDSGDLLLVHIKEGAQSEMKSHHIHTTYEVQVALSGHVLVESGTFATELEGPYVVVHKPYMPHRLRSLPDSATYYRAIMNFSTEMLSRAMTWVPHIEPLFEHNFLTFPLTEEQCRALFVRLEDARTLWRQKRWGACELAVALALDALADMAENAELSAVGVEIQYLNRVIQYIIEHLSERIICGDVARKFFISESKLAQDFKRCFGINFNQYLLQLRVKTAKDLLAAGESCTAVAAACGFCNTSYFIRVFKSFIGQTPAEYARACRGEK